VVAHSGQYTNQEEDFICHILNLFALIWFVVFTGMVSRSRSEYHNVVFLRLVSVLPVNLVVLDGKEGQVLVLAFFKELT
jgi:hypothetical protein